MKNIVGISLVTTFQVPETDVNCRENNQCPGNRTRPAGTLSFAGLGVQHLRVLAVFLLFCCTGGHLTLLDKWQLKLLYSTSFPPGGAEQPTNLEAPLNEIQLRRSVGILLDHRYSFSVAGNAHTDILCRWRQNILSMTIVRWSFSIHCRLSSLDCTLVGSIST